MFHLISLLAIVVGPWVTGMGNGGFLVSWTTETEGLGWVQLEDGRRIYNVMAEKTQRSSASADESASRFNS